MAVDRYLNGTGYEHPQESNLLNIHKTMQYNSQGQPVARVHVDGITLEGDVLVDTVSLSSSTLAALESINVQNTVSVTVSNFPTTSTVFQGTDPWVITGTVRVSNFTSTVFVSNTLTFSNTSFAITNFPTTSTVFQGTDPWNITGTVVASNFTSTVNIASMPAVSGTVAISSLPAITGTVSINNSVTITNTSFAITNFPTTSTVFQGTNPWTVTGTVAISSLPEVEIKNDSGNPIPVSGNITATLTGTNTFTLGTGSTDAFGRLRVSEPYTLFDSRARYYDHNDFSSSTSTGGTVVYEAASSTFRLAVSTSNGSSVIRETKRVFPYQPGKSLLVLATFAMNTPKVNLRQRVGYFTTNNGIYFENDGVYNYLVIRSYSTGVLVEDRIRQDAWDNTFAALNVDRTQIFWTDIEWLGVGSVRCGFVINGAYVLCHTFHHANVVNNTTTYMTTAVLPVRYEITNTGATASSSMMRQICSTVISEGGYNAFTYSESAGRGTSVLRLSSAGTYYPLVSIRLASTRLDAIVLPRQVDVLSPTVNYYRWRLVANPTLTGATWAGTSTSGTVEYDTAATGVSGGIELQTGYVSSRELSELGADAFAFQLGRTLAGVSDIVTLTMAATSNNADVLAQIGWQEIT
jgi:hypothetical protein